MKNKGQLLFDFLTYLERNSHITEMTRQALSQEIYCFLEEQKQPSFCVFLDAGHGGMDKHGRYVTAPNKQHYHKGESFHQGGWFYEGVWNRQLLKEVKRYLDNLGITYHVVSHKWKDTPLSDRVEIANKVAQKYENSVYISLHANAYDGGKTLNVRGFEVYTSPGQTDSDKIADMHYRNVSKLLGGQIRMRTDPFLDGDHDKEDRF